MPRDGSLIQTHAPRGSALAVPDQLRPMSLPDALARPAEALIREGGLTSLDRPVFAPELRRDAAALLPSLTAALDTPPPDLARQLARAWLLSLVRGARFAPEGPAFEAFVDATHDATRDLPALVWCRETNVAALRAFDRWPSVAQVDRLLRDHAARKRLELKALRIIAREPPPAPPAALPRADALAGLRRVTDALAASRPEPRPGHVTETREHERRTPPPARPVPQSMIAAWRDANPLVRAARAEREEG